MNERVDLHHESDQVDRAIDEVVAALMRGSPRPGFGDRVVARLREAPVATTRHLAWPRWALAGATALAVCVAALVAYLAMGPTSRQPALETNAGTRPSAPAPPTTTAARDGDVPRPGPETPGPSGERVRNGVPTTPATRVARGTRSMRRGDDAQAAWRDTTSLEGPPPLTVPRLARPDPVAIASIEVESIGMQDLAIAPLVNEGEERFDRR
jgi:hypothetical protein